MKENNLNSCIYQGTTYHKRYTPKLHCFSYPIYFVYLDLDEIDQVHATIRHFSDKPLSMACFKQRDYLPDKTSALPLKQQILNKSIELGETQKIDKIYLLCQLRTWGLYFSPVNFYYCYSQDKLHSILAQVSNTPWNERYFYRVPFQSQDYICDKDFHVSPFNDLDMKYRWKTSEPDECLNLHLDNLHLDPNQSKIFHAGISLKRKPLTNKNFNQLLISFPAMCVKTVISIYWQALKLWLKGTPFYGYVADKQK